MIFVYKVQQVPTKIKHLRKLFMKVDKVMVSVEAKMDIWKYLGSQYR